MQISINIIFSMYTQYCKLKNCNYFPSSQERTAFSVYTLADGSLGDWFGGLMYSAGQQANEAVQIQLGALSFTRCVIFILLQV